MLKKQEIGRSMVEMLGVLAIVGVLSVGGIAGYTSAMNKHRANELLNEASKRAVVCVAQIAAGRTPSITEFTNPTGHTFEVKGADGTSAWANTDKQFTITITGVSEAVCNQMKNAAGGVIKDTCASGNGNNVKLTFNNDMSVDGGNSTPSGPTVEEDETADSCPTGSSTTFSAADATTKLVGSSRCYCTNATPVWDGTRCIEPSSTKACNSSTPCASGEYCRYKGVSGLTCYSNASNYPVTGNGSATEVNGTCEKIVGVKQTTDGQFYYSTHRMDWFSAKSWCEAIGKDLVSLDTVEDSPFNCSTSLYTCNGGDWTPFTNIGLTDYYWTAESYYSCFAWYVYVTNAFFPDGGRNDIGGGVALCE